MLAGPSGSFLVMTGYEKIQRNIMLGSSFMVIVLSVGLSNKIGIMGFALSILITFAFQNTLRVLAIIRIYNAQSNPT